jgi:hypothetical protein
MAESSPEKPDHSRVEHGGDGEPLRWNWRTRPTPVVLAGASGPGRCTKARRSRGQEEFGNGGAPVTNFASKGSDTGSEQDEDEEIGQLAVLR